MRKLGVVALSVAGVVVIVEGLKPLLESLWIAGALADGQGEVSLLSLALFLLGVLLTLGLGVMLIWKREALAARLFEDGDAELAIDGAGLVRAGLIIFGIVMFVDGIFDLVGAASSWESFRELAAQFDDAYMVDTQQRWSLISSFVTGVLGIAGGAALSIGSARISTWLWKPILPPSNTDTAEFSATCPSCGVGYDPQDYRDMSSAKCTECGEPLSQEVPNPGFEQNTVR